MRDLRLSGPLMVCALVWACSNDDPAGSGSAGAGARAGGAGDTSGGTAGGTAGGAGGTSGVGGSSGTSGGGGAAAGAGGGAPGGGGASGGGGTSSGGASGTGGVPGGGASGGGASGGNGGDPCANRADGVYCGQDLSGSTTADARYFCWKDQTAGMMQCSHGCAGGSCLDQGGGSPSPHFGGFDCQTCLSASCSAEQSACIADSACTLLLVCVFGCDSPQCVETCRATLFPAGVSAFDEFTVCIVKSCDLQCQLTIPG
jgi:hypothetical protein